MTGILNELPPGYEEAQHIGAGGWAEVYRCIETASGHEVALKLFHARLADPAKGAEQFEQECRTAEMLGAHPGMVTLRAAGVTASANPWLAMDLATGGTLADRIKKSGHLPTAVAIDIAIGLAEALSWAHTLPSPVIHGDIKPANVLLNEQGRPLLTDFGVSTLLGARRSVTVAQFTDTYAAPEVLSEGRASVSSDVWALMVTFFESLTGVAPFAPQPGEGAGTFIKRVERGLPADAIPASVPAEVAAVIRAGLEVDRAQRIPTMASVAESLRAAQRSLGLPPTPPWPSPSPTAPALRFVSYAEATAVTKLRRLPPPAANTVDVVPNRRTPMLVLAGVLVLILVGITFLVFKTVIPSTAGPNKANDPPTTSSVPSAGNSPTGNPGTVPSTSGPSSTAPTSSSPTPGAAATAPGPPTQLSALASDASATISWAAASANGAPVTKYSVAWRQTAGGSAGGTVTVAGNRLSAQVNGLQNGSTYSATVYATNSAGQGPGSSSPSFTPSSNVPGSPSNVHAAAVSTGNVTVSWSAADGRGHAIKTYAVTANGGDGSTAKVAETSGTQANISGLTLGTTYRFVVRATNDIGVTGAPSGQSGPITPYRPANQPTGFSAKPADGSMTLSWSAPSLNGGDFVHYLVHVNGQTDKTVTAPTAQFTGLSNGTSYAATVLAVTQPHEGGSNVNGATASTSATPGRTATADVTSASLSGDRQITVGVSVNLFSSGAATCHLYFNGSNLWNGGCTSTVTVGGLAYSTTYDIYATTTNNYGNGGAGSHRSATTNSPPKTITLSRGGSAPAGYWYSVVLSNFTPGSSVTVTCRDSVDPGGFYNQTFVIAGNGTASDSTLCYSGDHPDHWVTGGGAESNHVTW